MVVQQQLFAQLRSQVFGAPALAGLGPAQAQGMARGRCGTEIVVEADHAVHFSQAEVEGMGDLGDGGVGDVPTTVLNGVENGQQGTGSVLFALQYAVNQRQVKRVIRHKRTSASRTPPPHSGSRQVFGCSARPRHGGVDPRSPFLLSGQVSWRTGSGHPGSLPITIARRLHPGDPSCPESDLLVRSADPHPLKTLKQAQRSPRRPSITRPPGSLMQRCKKRHQAFGAFTRRLKTANARTLKPASPRIDSARTPAP